jgi:hypothetical protein
LRRMRGIDALGYKLVKALAKIFEALEMERGDNLHPRPARRNRLRLRRPFRSPCRSRRPRFDREKWMATNEDRIREAFHSFDERRTYAEAQREGERGVSRSDHFPPKEEPRHVHQGVQAEWTWRHRSGAENDRSSGDSGEDVDLHPMTER